MNLTQLLISFGACSLLISIALVAGCTGMVKTTPVTPSVETTLPVELSTPAITNSCPLPKLIFNNSQEITKFGQRAGLRFTGQNSSSTSEPGTVPYRGVVYHDVGFTRIFDSTGKQILFVNDSDSMIFIPAGYSVPITYCYGINENMVPRDGGNNVTNIYESGVDTCIASIIYVPGSFRPSAILGH
jgi:hypothetical protein